jgi:hypothetical protein
LCVNVVDCFLDRHNLRTKSASRPDRQDPSDKRQAIRGMS